MAQGDRDQLGDLLQQPTLVAGQLLPARVDLERAQHRVAAGDRERDEPAGFGFLACALVDRPGFGRGSTKADSGQSHRGLQTSEHLADCPG